MLFEHFISSPLSLCILKIFSRFGQNQELDSKRSVYLCSPGVAPQFRDDDDILLGHS